MPEPKQDLAELAKVHESLADLAASSTLTPQQFQNVAISYLQMQTMMAAPDVVTGLKIFASVHAESAKNIYQLIATLTHDRSPQ